MNVSEPAGTLETVRVLSVTAMCVLNFVALVGNLSNIIVILKCHQLRHTLTNLFVLNLCVVDLSASLFVMPVSVVTFVQGSWSMNSFMCTLNGFINSLLTFASITSLCVISIERYYSIRLPMHHAANMTLCRTLFVIGFTWLESVVFAALPLMGLSSYQYRSHKKHCSFTWEDVDEGNVYVFVIGFWCFILPGIILVVMYYGIFTIARSAALQVKPHQSISINVTASDPNQCAPVAKAENTRPRLPHNPRPTVFLNRVSKSERKQWKAIKTLVVIMTAYMALWGPYFILHIHGAIRGNVSRREMSEILTTWLGYVSFALNPFLYGWMNRTIRAELVELYKAVFCRLCASKQSDEDESRGQGEDFWQFLERTSARHIPTPVQPGAANQEKRQCDTNFNNENTEICF